MQEEENKDKMKNSSGSAKHSAETKKELKLEATKSSNASNKKSLTEDEYDQVANFKKKFFKSRRAPPIDKEAKGDEKVSGKPMKRSAVENVKESEKALKESVKESEKELKESVKELPFQMHQNLTVEMAAAEMQITENADPVSNNFLETSPRPVVTSNDPPVKPGTVQTVIMQKTRSNECFADADMTGSKLNKSTAESKAKSKTYIISDPQTASVTATVTVPKVKPTDSTKVKEAAEVMLEPVDAEGEVTKNVRKYESSTLAKSIFRPVHEVHPTQKSFSSSAIQSHIANAIRSNGGDAQNISTSTLDSGSTLKSPVISSGPVTPSSAILLPTKATSDLKETLTNRISKGFFELTQGSSDRLQRWKSKLQSGRRHKEAANSSASSGSKMHGNTEAEILVDWAPANLTQLQNTKPDKFPIMETSVEGQKGRSYTTKAPCEKPSVIGDNANKNLNLPDLKMEHRTLRQRDENGAKQSKNLSIHYQNMKNLHRLVKTVEGVDAMNNNLPPPARITPYSGMKPQDADIIRPVAFRPFVAKRCDAKDPVTSVLSFGRQEAELQKKITSSDELERNGSLPMPEGSRRGMCQPSTSSEASSLASVQYSARSVKSDIEENDYDVVPEYYERDKVFSDDSACCESYSALRPFVQRVTPPSKHRSVSKTKYSGFTNLRNFPLPSAFKKSLSTHQVYSINDGRRSSGVHITPSPSDSGIVDYETIIRDKENELSNVRTTMEQNEEIIIRVYQEKERVWEEEIAELKQKLQASQQGENALRLQIQLCNEQRDEFQTTINNLVNDKNILQKKCFQLERDVFRFREMYDDLQKNKTVLCESCQRHLPAAEEDKKNKVPIPAPRHNKEATAEKDLRSEVEQLRHEVCSLRETLGKRIGLFSDDKKWEHDRPQDTSVVMNGKTPKEVRNQKIEGRAQNPAKNCVISGDRLI